MVTDEAPQLFAIIQEYGERVDGRIAAWGMSFDDHAEVVSVARGVRGSLRTPPGRAAPVPPRQPHPRPAGVVQPGRGDTARGGRRRLNGHGVSADDRPVRAHQGVLSGPQPPANAVKPALKE